MSLFVDGGFSMSGGQAQESEQGANAALTELDKGLRSTKIGEQSEAIVRFPRLFEKYPFPILINSAMLKLADIFRQGSNFLKLCVLRVCQESERHLDKVTSVDELVRRVLTVIHSNDPVARALTLRTLGALSPIIPERKPVHHKVRSGLDSQDSVELEAAIYAATRFAARSKTFSVDMCPRLLEMIEGYATPIQVKLKLIPVFEHMHHDAHTAALVRGACLTMLPSYPGQDFIIITLRTLTSLAKHTLVDIPDQVSLLLKYLRTDPRKHVRSALLSDLHNLASSQTAHLWTKENVSDMIQFASSSPGEGPLVAALTVLIRIIETGGVYQLELVTGSPLMKLCESSCYSPQLSVSTRATQLLVQLAASCAREGVTVTGVDIVGEAVMAMEALCLLVSSQTTPGHAELLRRCLRCVVVLSSTQPQATGQFVDILGGMLSAGAGHAETTGPLCETLAALGSIKPDVLALLVPDICHTAHVLSSSPSLSSNPDQSQTLVLLNTLLLQTLRGHTWPEEVDSAVSESLSSLSGWYRYRVGRAAARYGHHWLAKDVFNKLKASASTQTTHDWLSSLAMFSEAETILAEPGSQDLQERMMSAVTTYHRGLASLRSASSAQHPRSFQLEFCQCRVEVIQVVSQLVWAATSLRTSPPPAIAAALALQSRDDLQRCGRVTSQLRKVVKELEGCSQKLARLYQSCFDADSSSLAQLSVLQQATASLSQWIEMVCLKSSLQGSMYLDTEIEFNPTLPLDLQPDVALQGLISVIQKVAGRFRSLASVQDSKPISHQHTSCLYDAVEILNSCPMPFPRFFYQSLKQTRLKLSVTPQPKTSGEPVPVNTSQMLAVKVEGVLERGGGGGQGDVHGVVVQLTAGLQPGSKPHEGKIDTNVSLEKEAEPHNDFFSSQFLVPFPVAGLYSLAVETLLVDGEGQRWRTGTTQSLTVKSFEDRTNANRISRS